MKKTVAFCLILCALLALKPAFASPGEMINSIVLDPFWGHVLLGFLIIFFLPFVVHSFIREKLAEKRARADLYFMTKYSPVFDWLKIQERAKACFLRIHSDCWEKEDLSSASEWMTTWYWQNQQLVRLKKWKEEDFVNMCDIKRIYHIKPLLFVHRNQGMGHEHSMVVIAIEAKMKNCLQVRSTGKVVEGSKRYKKVKTVWSFTLECGVWKVSDIEEDIMSIEYAKLVSDLPKIESTVASDLGV